MLSELYINNLAVIKQATIQFGKNLNVFTGETGAGKSILINGINAVLGQRTSKEIVRSGADKSVIIALFTSITGDTKSKLQECGVDYENDEISVTREIFSDGGSVARINSRPVAVSVLREIGQTLINIHGQHDNQVLLSPENHIAILDDYAELNDKLQDYKSCFKELQDTARKIKKLIQSEEDIKKKAESLNEFISQYEQLDIKENEDQEVDKQFKLLENSALLTQTITQVLVLLNGDDEDIKGVITLSSEANEKLQPMTDLLPELEGLSKRLKAANIEIDDISGELSHMISQLDFDAENFDYLTQRRDEINKIKRKYGPLLDDVIDKYNSAVEEISIIDSNEFEIGKLNEKKEKLLLSVTEKAKKLSDLREIAVKKFIKNVENELKFLDMPNVKLDVLLTKGKLTINGMDTIEFLISANIGEPPKPIAKIASGGELSRIMLALKSVLADKDNIPTLIFDEIDSGVSGRAAQKIGIKLDELGKLRQVLCVTHLSQIAVMADTHLCIEKKVIDNTTQTSVKELSFEDRKYEIARIMGGDNITDLMLKNAEELIVNSKQKN